MLLISTFLGARCEYYLYKKFPYFEDCLSTISKLKLEFAHETRKIADSSSPFDGFLEECLEPSEKTDKLVPLTKVLEFYNIYLAKLYPQKHKISIRKLSSELETRGYEFHTPSTKKERSEHGYRKCLKGYDLDLSLLGLNTV